MRGMNEAPSSAAGKQPRNWMPCIIAVGVVAAYCKSLHGAFIFDDVPWILNNERIRNLWPPTWPQHTSRPVVMFTLALNYALGGLDVRGYHVINVAIHLASAFALYGVVRRTFALVGVPRANTLAGASALLWAVHPIQTESVTYVVQRAESLMGLCFLLTLYCVIRGWKLAAIVTCAVGMGTKPTMVVCPLVVLVYDKVFLSATWGELFWRKWRLHLGLMSTWLVLLVVAGLGWREWLGSAAFDVPDKTVWSYARSQPPVILEYLSLSIWPARLCLLPSTPPLSPAATIGVVALLLVTCVTMVRYPKAAFPAFWFFATLAPTSSVIPLLHPMFEHRMYLPLAGLAVGVVLVLQRFRAVVWVIAAALCVATIARNADYRTEVSILQDTARKAADNPQAHYGLALAFATAGRTEEALESFARAVELKPYFAKAHYDWGLTLYRAGRLAEAADHFREALRINPDYHAARQNLFVILREQATGGSGQQP